MSIHMAAGLDRPDTKRAADNNNEAEHYMRIGELADEFKVSLRTLRFYEDKGLLSPKRAGATRLFSRRDRARLKLILMGRKVGFSLREVKQMLDLYKGDAGNERQYKVFIDKSVKQIEKLKRQRATIDEAIGELQSAVAEIRDRLSAGTN